MVAAKEKFFDKKIVIKVIKWLVFGVFLTIVPILTDFVINASHTKQPEFAEVIKKGEMILVCAGIAGASIGELIGSGKSQLGLKLLTGGGCVLVLIGASGWYASIASDVRSKLPYNSEFVARGSMWLLWISIIAGIGCVLVPGDEV